MKFIILFIFSFASFFLTQNSNSQVLNNAQRAEYITEIGPKGLFIDFNEIPIPETNVYRTFGDSKVDKSDDLYVYEYYDRNGNSYLSIEPPTKELRYECPVCNGDRVLQTYKFNHKTCWRCNGNGYLISNSGK